MDMARHIRYQKPLLFGLLQIKLEATNENYFQVSMNSLAITIQAPETVGTCEDNDTLTVNGRSSKKVS